MVSSGSCIVRSLRANLLGLVWDFFPSCLRSFLPDFLLLYCYYACICSYFLLHPCLSHARGILCGIHTSCMRSPVSTVHTRCSLVFLARCYGSIELLNYYYYYYYITNCLLVNYRRPIVDYRQPVDNRV